MDRRTFLAGLGTLGLNSCQLFPKEPSYRITLLANSFPSQLVRKFEEKYGVKLAPTLVKTYKEIQEMLLYSKDPMPQIIGIGDSWLQNSISTLQPIDTQQITSFTSIQEQWHPIIQRFHKTWGIPYRWGTTVIAYQKKRLQKAGIPPINSWADLWHPGLRGRITLPDSFREVIGLTLKKMQLSYNEENVAAIPALRSSLRSLHQQVLTYTSTHYLHSLIMEDSWVAVGWSADFGDTTKRYPTIEVTVPKEGSALWCDLWAIPKGVSALEPVYAWINFSLQPESSKLITQLTSGIATLTPQDLSSKTRKQLSPEVLGKCEILQRLSPQAEGQYLDLWTTVRQKEV